VEFGDDMPVGVDVLIDHAVTAESLDGDVVNLSPVEFTDSLDCRGRRFGVSHQRAGRAIDDELRHGASVESDHRGTTHHGLGNREPERLVEVDQMEQSNRTTQEA